MSLHTPNNKSLLGAFIIIIFQGCTFNKRDDSTQEVDNNKIECNDNRCQGSYEGPEFVGTSDIAHQFSNKMSAIVGDKLKELYKKEKYSKVDFNNINMSTKGMGSGDVIYRLSIPFIRVEDKCEAYTSFDHVGGWNHSPALNERKEQLSILLLEGESLDISDLKITSEGLQEYWIQWKNKDIQQKCN